MILFQLQLPLILRVSIHKSPQWFLLWMPLSLFTPPIKNKIILLKSPKQDIYLYFSPSLNFSLIEPGLSYDLFSTIISSLGRNYSWPSAVGIWTSTYSFAISSNYSTTFPSISYIASSSRKGFLSPYTDLTSEIFTTSYSEGSISEYDITKFKVSQFRFDQEVGWEFDM